MRAAFRLPMLFEPSRLLSELIQLEHGEKWHNHPDYTVAQSGDWTAIALLSSSTQNHEDPQSLRHRGGHDKAFPTRVLTASPYFQEVIETFRTDVHRARLMNLRPGTRITAHRDYGRQRYSLERGYIRVHIPVRTHPAVKFWLAGDEVPMQAGEAWYTNVCELHAVHNDSDVHRVHLVLDMKVNDWVRSLFPRQGVGFAVRGAILRTCEPSFLKARKRAETFYRTLRKLAGDLGGRKIRERLLRKLRPS